MHFLKMKIIQSICTAILLMLSFMLSAQNTVGLISIDQDKTLGGYNLIYPENQPTVFLLNGCGQIVHTWDDDAEFRPGKTAYLHENGNLLRAKTSNNIVNSFGAGGAGGIVELLSWDNDPLWSITLADSLNRQHHDVLYLDNGNVMMIVWELKNLNEMIENGFDTISFSIDAFWPDYILEINPLTNERVWEWHVWDHLVQDFDATKLNYGVVAEHPELVDLNYQELSFERKDFMHANAIDYDPVKDQVLISVRNFNEIWIIDHSTTTAEAAGHTGGNSGKGGDLIYRWGNPLAYDNGSLDEQQLFNQHDAQWIDDFVDAGYEHFGKIVLFNNRVSQGVSVGNILEPVWEEATQSYAMQNGVYLPLEFTETISHPDSSKNFSSNASSIQVVGDGAVIMCAAGQGFMFELTNDGDVAWEYRTPLKFGQPIQQGFDLSVNDNFTFQCERYPEDFPAFFGKDLSPKGYIELNPNIGFCTLTNVEETPPNEILVYPNPITDQLIIEHKKEMPFSLEVINCYGQLISALTISGNKNVISTSSWPAGVYYLKIKNGKLFEKLIKVN